MFDGIFGRRDVIECFAGLIIAATIGPQASKLRVALRLPALDRHLERIARGAVQPSVRAVALHALIEGKAEWPDRPAWQWIDKPMGIRRRVMLFHERPLTITCLRDPLIDQGLRDRSAVVRTVALTGMIRHMAGSAKAAVLAAPLAADRSRAVRERAEFILRSRSARIDRTP